MSIFEEQMMDMVFRRTTAWDFQEMTLTGPMLRVLAALDGVRTLGEIRQSLDMHVEAMKEIVRSLADSDLVALHAAGTAIAASPHASAEAPKKTRYMVYRGVSCHVPV